MNQMDDLMQEPVAWQYSFTHSSAIGHGDYDVGPLVTDKKDVAFGVGCFGQLPLYTTPPRCPNCASLEAQNTELDHKLAEVERQEPVSGVVIREGLPTLLQDRDIKSSDQPLYTADQMREYAKKAVEAEREACAKVCEEKQEYSMPISCPDGISGCLVAHYIPARREKTGSECAAAIRDRR